MQEYLRQYPMFSLCGLNCGLCPRYQSEGSSKCPGCGGKDFNLKHPSCAVITCSKKHGEVEYCFLCKDYPCDRYKGQSEKDSFISYLNVKNDFQKAINGGIEQYKADLNEKISFLEFLINDYNDGRKKGFYCIAVNVLDLSDLNDIKERIKGLDKAMPKEDKIKTIGFWFNEKAKNKNIDLTLRK